MEVVLRKKKWAQNGRDSPVFAPRTKGNGFVLLDLVHTCPPEAEASLASVVRLFPKSLVVGSLEMSVPPCGV